MQLKGKKVIALGERDGVQGTAIANCARSAGADVVFLEAPTTVDELKVAAGSFGVPTMANMIEGGKTPFLSTDELEKLGFRIAAYPHSLILSCIRTIQKTLTELKERGSTAALTGDMADFSELDELIGFPEARAWEAKYTPPETG